MTPKLARPINTSMQGTISTTSSGFISGLLSIEVQERFPRAQLPGCLQASASA